MLSTVAMCRQELLGPLYLGQMREEGKRGRALHERLAHDASLSQILIFEAEREAGCGFPFKGLAPHIDMYHWTHVSIMGQVVSVRGWHSGFGVNRLLAV